MVRLLVDAGAAINAFNVGHSTPLHEAALTGHSEVVALLLEQGAIPDIKNRWNATALDLAKAGGHQDIVRMLENRVKKLD